MNADIKNAQLDERATGRQLMELRKKCGYTCEDVAGMLNISSDTLKSYEYGARRPPLNVLKSLCSVYHRTNIEELIIWKE